MTAPLAGIKVLEVASWLAAPNCAALMSDMGAEVIKVEPPGGDSYRRMYDALLGPNSVHPSYQLDNRGKRGVCINLEDPAGPELVRELATDADVFITNLTRPRLEKYGLTDTDIHAIYPQAIYAVLSGYGTVGPDSERQAFDQTAFWARSGAMSMFGDRGGIPLLSPRRLWGSDDRTQHADINPRRIAYQGADRRGPVRRGHAAANGSLGHGQRYRAGPLRPGRPPTRPARRNPPIPSGITTAQRTIAGLHW